MIKLISLLLLSCVAAIVIFISFIVAGCAYLYDFNKKRFDTVSSIVIKRLGGKYIGKGFDFFSFKALVPILLCVMMVSCSEQSKVQYLSGKIEHVLDQNDIGESGDSVVVEHSIYLHKGLGISSDSHIWGLYVGTIPEERFREDSLSTSRTWYEIAIKQ